MARDLKKDGVCVLKLIGEDDPVTLSKWRERFRTAVSTFREYKSPSVEDTIVLGGFRAFGNPSSYHNIFVRRLRRLAFLKVLDTFKEYDTKYRDGESNFHHIPDRMLYRPAGVTPTSREMWHRDLAVNLVEGDEVFGGWVNLSKETTYLSCIKGSNFGPWEVGRDEGFYMIKDDEQKKEFSKNKSLVEIPSGHIVIFNQSLVHEVLVKKYGKPMYRLFTGWRLTKGTEPISDVDKAIREQGSFLLPGGSKPELYIGMFRRFHQAKIQELTENMRKRVLVDDKAPMYLESLEKYGFEKYPKYKKKDVQILHPRKLW